MNDSDPPRKLTPADTALVLSIAVICRLLFGWAAFHAPVFEKYLTLGADLLRNGMSHPFTSSPVYIAWIAALIKLFGHQPELFRIIQFGMGITTVALTAGIAAHIFGRPAGIAAGIIMAVSGPAVMYEADLVTAPLMALIACGSFRLFQWALVSGNPWTWLSTGILLGLGAGIRPTIILLIGAVAIYCLVIPAYRRILNTLLLLTGAAAAILPITLANHTASGKWIPVTASGGSVFYSSNNYRATGLGYSPPESLTELENRIMQTHSTAVPVEHQLFKYLAERASSRQLNYSQVSSFYLHEGLKYLQRDYFHAAGLTLRKLYYWCNRYEVRDTASLVNLSVIKQQVLPMLPGFGLLFVLASLGLLWTLDKPGKWVPLALFIAPHILTGVIFYVNGRLRYPAMPLLAVWAGYAVVNIIQDARGFHPRLWAILVWCMAMTAITTSEDTALRTHRTVQTPVFLSTMQGLAEMKANHPESAATHFINAVELNPLGAREALSNLAILFRQSGQTAQAVKIERQAAGQWTLKELQQMEPLYTDNPVQHRLALATTLWHQGNKPAARQIFTNLTYNAPLNPDPYYNLAVIHLAPPNPDPATALKELTIALDLGLKLDLQSTRARQLQAQCFEILGNTTAAAAVREHARWEQLLQLP